MVQVLKWAHNPQAQELIRIKYPLEKEILGIDYDLINRRFYRSLRKTRELLRNDRCLFGLQNQWIFPNLVRRQEKFCNACEDDRVLECEIR